MSIVSFSETSRAALANESAETRIGEMDARKINKMLTFEARHRVRETSLVNW